MQLTVDGLGSDPSAWTPALAEALSEELVIACDMHKFFGPRCYVSGTLLVCFTLIAESHISLHLDRASGLAWVDVFTCKAMPDDLAPLIAARLGLPSPTVHLDRERGALPSLNPPLHPEPTLAPHVAVAQTQVAVAQTQVAAS